MAKDYIEVRTELPHDAKTHAIADGLASRLDFRFELLRRCKWDFDLLERELGREGATKMTAIMSRDMGAVMNEISHQITVPVVVTALIAVWTHANRQGETVDGDTIIKDKGPELVDRWAGIDGFAAQMIAVDWLIVETDIGSDNRPVSRLIFPKFVANNTPVDIREKSARKKANDDYQARKKLMAAGWRKDGRQKGKVMIPPDAPPEKSLEALLAEGWTVRSGVAGIDILAAPGTPVDVATLPTTVVAPLSENDNHDRAKGTQLNGTQPNAFQGGAPAGEAGGDAIHEERLHGRKPTAQSTRPAPRKGLIPAALQGSAFETQWDKWEAHWRANGWNLTGLACHEQLEFLTTLGVADAVLSLRAAIRAGSRYLDPPRKEKHNGGAGVPGRSHDPSRCHAPPGKYAGVSQTEESFTAARAARGAPVPAVDGAAAEGARQPAAAGVGAGCSF